MLGAGLVITTVVDANTTVMTNFMGRTVSSVGKDCMANTAIHNARRSVCMAVTKPPENACKIQQKESVQLTALAVTPVRGNVCNVMAVSLE